MELKLALIGVDVFLERRKTHLYVGQLRKEMDHYIFTYDNQYLHSQNIIPLGPEFPLTKREFKAKQLFPSLENRIPSKLNPAYPEYCQFVGIDPKETNPLILLSTIGKRGPSSFVFAPFYDRLFTVQQTIDFRNSLGFTTREFAEIFEIPQASLNALERRRSSGKDLLKRLEIIVRFPAVALYFLFINGGVLPYKKHQKAENFLMQTKTS